MTDNTTPYQRLGGETGIRALVDRFYDLMDSEPEAQGIREMHAKSLRASREKLFLFLSGWLGGPDLYVQKYGHPRLRARHLPFSIGIAERDQWLHCMNLAIAETALQPHEQERLKQAFFATADHMRNKAEYAQEAGLQIFPGTQPPKG